MEDKSIGRKRKDEEESEDAEGNVPDKEIGLGDKEVLKPECKIWNYRPGLLTRWKRPESGHWADLPKRRNLI